MANMQNLIPSSKDLYFLFYELLHSHYNLIPQLYDDNNNVIVEHRATVLVDHTIYRYGRKYKPSYHHVLYELSCGWFDKHELYRDLCLSTITEGISMNKFLSSLNVDFSDIIKIIAQMMMIVWIPFELDTSTSTRNDDNNTKSNNNDDNNNNNKNSDDYCYTPKLRNQLVINDAKDEVRFSNARRDFVNVMGDHQLNLNHNNIWDGKLKINTFILGLRDEMWIGIMCQEDFSATGYIENGQRAIFYYCNHHKSTRIDAFSEEYRSLSHVDSFDVHDWITIEIDFNKKQVVFLKNDTHVTTVEISKAMLDSNDIVWAGILDTPLDGFYIEYQ